MKVEIIGIFFLTAATYCLLTAPALIARNGLRENPVLLEVRLDRVSHRVHESMIAASIAPDEYLEKFNAQELTVTPEFVDSGEQKFSAVQKKAQQ